MNTSITKLYCLKYTALALPLAFAGLPVYIHVPRFYASVMQLDLSSLGILLFVIRLADTVIDPFIGIISDRLVTYRKTIIFYSALLLSIGYFATFSPPELAFKSPALWLAGCLFIVYFAFSTLMINYYAIGVEISHSANDNIQIASWREGFILLGVLLASILPTLLLQHYDFREAYQLFALSLLPLMLVGVLITLQNYKSVKTLPLIEKINFFSLLKDKKICQILLLAFFNAIPTAITSTLFMFFTADVLGTSQKSGYMLAIYFLSAAISTPFWNYTSLKAGKRMTLITAMLAAIICFVWAGYLGAGDSFAFFIICVLSGFTMGADMMIMPALFADSLKDKKRLSATAFGLWNLTSKLTTAFAAGIALPLLSLAGYHSDAPNTKEALAALSLCYALLPCLFKIVAVVFLYFNKNFKE